MIHADITKFKLAQIISLLKGDVPKNGPEKIYWDEDGHFFEGRIEPEHGEEPSIDFDFENYLEEIPGTPSSNLLFRWDCDYDYPEEQRDFYFDRPLIDLLLKEQKLQALFEFLVAAPAEVLDAQVEFARKQGATFSFSQAATDAGVPASSSVFAPRPAAAPPRWAERTTGREVSPVDWIKMHYGNKDPQNWQAMGLTRDMLRQIDRPLYQAFGTFFSRLRKSPDSIIPVELEPLLESPSDRAAAELRKEKIISPEDIKRLSCIDPVKAERLRGAIRRRL